MNTRAMPFLIAGLSLLLVGVATSSVAVAQESEQLYERLTDEEKLTVIELIDEGTDAYNAGDFEAALNTYNEVYELFPHPDFLYRIGLCHQRLGNEESALDYYREFLEAAPDAEERGRVESTIASLEEKLAVREGELHVDTTPEGALLYVDDRDSAPVGETPTAISLASGEHSIIVEKSGYETLYRNVEINDGERVSVEWTLEPVAIEEPADVDEAGRSLWQPATSLALVGIGGWSLYRSMGHRQQYRSEFDELQQWRHDNIRAGNEAEHEERVESVNRERRWAIGMGTVGAISLVGATTLTTLWLLDDDDQPLALRLSPTVEGPGLRLQGRF